MLAGLRSIAGGFRSRAIDRSWERGLEPGGAGSDQLVKPPSRELFRQELAWLGDEVVLLVVITNANPSERWSLLVLLLVILGYWIERFLVVSEDHPPLQVANINATESGGMPHAVDVRRVTVDEQASV